MSKIVKLGLLFGGVVIISLVIYYGLNFTYDDAELVAAKEFDLTNGHTISYFINGATISNMEFITDHNSLVIDLQINPKIDGNIQVFIPVELYMYEDYEREKISLFVIQDGEEILFDFNENEDVFMAFIEFDKDAKRIEIIGSYQI